MAARRGTRAPKIGDELQDIADTIEAAADGISLELQTLGSGESPAITNRDHYRIAIFPERIHAEAERLRTLSRQLAGLDGGRA